MSTNRVTVNADQLVVEPVGIDKFWSFTRKLEFPITQVRGATFDPGMRGEPRGWRGPGLAVPGKYCGTFHAEGERQFWNVSGFEHTIVITLDPAEHFTRLILTVDDPTAVVDAINHAVGPTTERAR